MVAVARVSMDSIIIIITWVSGVLLLYIILK